MQKTESELIAHLNSYRESFLDDLGCEISRVDFEQKLCEMQFDINERYCHSGDIIQGGFVTAMLDAVSTHAVFLAAEGVTAVATLELKVSFLEASRMGRLRAVGRVDKISRTIAFMSGELYNSEGHVTATISTTAKYYAKPTR